MQQEKNSEKQVKKPKQKPYLTVCYLEGGLTKEQGALMCKFIKEMQAISAGMPVGMSCEQLQL